MTEQETRFHHIDILVEDSGHSYNPLTERFEATVGTDAENNLDHDWQSLRTSLAEEVGEEEFREYMHWKAEQAEASLAESEAEALLEEHEKEQGE